MKILYERLRRLVYVNKRSGNDENMVIEKLRPNKIGRPLLLSASLDSAVQQYLYILKLRERKRMST